MSGVVEDETGGVMGVYAESLINHTVRDFSFYPEKDKTTLKHSEHRSDMM